MLNYLRRYIGGNILLKITSFNAVAIAVRIAAGLITSKVIATYLGAPGMALMGDLRNFLSSAQSLSTLGIYNGVVKYTAQHKVDRPVLGKVLSTSLLLILTASSAIAAILFFGAPYWNDYLFGSAYNFTFVFQLLGLALPFYALNTYLLAIINGFSHFKKIIYINIATNILGLLTTVSLIYVYAIKGAFIAIVLIPSIALVITGFFIFRKYRWLALLRKTNFSAPYVKKFGSYMGMTLFSAVASPWIFIGIREHIIKVDSLNHAGYWDGMLRISDYYLMFVTTILTLYILPKLSATTTAKGFRNEIFNFYKTILPLFGIGLIGIYLLRNFVVRLVFTDDFLGMAPIFGWQLFGDFLRVASIVVAYQFLAKNMFWTFIGTQIFSLATIYFSSVLFVDYYGFVGAAMGHAFSYFIYLITVLYIFRKALFLETEET